MSLPPEEDEWAQTYRDCGYEWCRPHGEWHRPPECSIAETGAPWPWWADQPEDAETITGAHGTLR